jgi:hypothetical protein
VRARLLRTPRSNNFYGGVLFKATPRFPGRPPQITNVLQLNATVLLDPPRRLRHPRFRVDRIRAEQAGSRRLRLLVPVRNSGNVYLPASGRITVRGQANSVRLRQRLKTIKILPGYVVDLPSVIVKVLPAGVYRLAAVVHAGRHTYRTAGRMRLYGPNALAARSAKLVAFPAPTAYKGETTSIRASFRNTGNVPYAPKAVLEVRENGPQGPTTVRRRVRLDVSRASPRGTGEITGDVQLSDTAASDELTVNLLEGRRVLDSRTVSVTPKQRPGLLTRIKDFIIDHALLIVGVLLALLLVAALGMARFARQMRRPPES